MRRVLRYCCLIASIPTLGSAAPTRVTNTSLNLPADLPSGTYSTTNAFSGLSFSDPVAITTPPGETNRLFIVEKPGRIAVIPDLTNPTREVFLDIVSRVRSTSSEEGLLGLAFHPNYNNVDAIGYGEFFVYFQTTISNQRYWRLSRFTVNPNDPDRGLSNSEVPMITQLDQAGNHNGGDLHFGDDGYLYIAVGDEGGSNDGYDNGQHIDKDFFAAILRIDVDSLPDNPEPNSHTSVETGTYRIPADNPFVGATTFNGSSVTPSNVRTEIWAIGMRNPWRMSFDRPTRRLFVADVGQVTREEINILDAASFASNGGIPNYGWAYREGFLAFTNGPNGATPPAGFSAIDPIHDYPRSQGTSVTGGLVYRGSQYPELTGDYLFADYISGRIWAMDDPGGSSQSVSQIATDNNIAGFGINPATGDILLGDLGSDTVKRIVRTTGGGTQPPQFLSETGAFSNLTNLTAGAGILPYSINVPFWSDHAEKTRWFSVPDLTDDMTWAQDENWDFPEGQVWIKHFELELDRDSPGTERRRIETRFLVKTADDVYGITYRWNAAQTDAELVVEGGDTVDFTITEGGETRTQTWVFPSRNDCRSCHTQVAGGALSFNTRQLNSLHDYGSGDENQLDALETAGYFSNAIPSPGGLPEYHPADDEGATLEERARSFLSVNCVSCHQDGGAALGEWDAQPWLTLEQSGIVDSPVSNNGGDPHARTVVPGDLDSSMILQRLISARGNAGSLPAMPPLGSTEANEEGIALLTAWIEETPRVLFVRGADRSGGFLEAGNDTQRTEHLADIGNYSTSGGNHGWGELADVLSGAGFDLEQITETAENGSGPSLGVHIDFENVNLDQYDVVVFGSNNALYDTAAVDAIDAYIRGGGGALFISDANFGGNWADASNSDQQFLDRFGMVMNQDQGTYSLVRSSGDFLVPSHPILENVDQFDGEGVTPITVGTLPVDVNATILARAKNNVRRNPQPPGSSQGPSESPGLDDAALVVATASDGRIAGHFDRNTFFNLNGAGTNINRFENEQFAINLFTWLATENPPDPVPNGLTASDGSYYDRIELTWNAVADATQYTVYRNTTNDFGSATVIGTPNSIAFNDTTAAYGTTYFYWVTSIIDSTESSPSDSAQGSRILAVPTGLTASDGDFTDRVELAWAGVSEATGYTVYRSTMSTFGSATSLASTASTSYSDSTATLGVSYFYWIVATADGNESAPTGHDSGYAALPAPDNLTATNGNSTRHIALTWNTVSGASGYRVYRGTTNSHPSAVEIANPSSNSYIDNSTSLSGGRTYFYWVSAVANNLESSLSAVDSGARAIPPVGSLTASGNSTAGIALSWNANPDAMAYEIFRGSTDNFANALLINSTSSNNFFDQTATGGAEYFYWVVATNDYGSSTSSSPATGSRRAYTFQPDLSAGKSTASLKGNNTYGGGILLSIAEAKRRPVSGVFMIQNDGETTDQIRISAPKKNRFFKLSYIRIAPSTANVTGAITRSQYVTGVIGTAASEVIRATAKPTRLTKVSRRTRKFLIDMSAVSVTAPVAADRISIKAVSKK